MRSMVEGCLCQRKDPSTTLRVVPPKNLGRIRVTAATPTAAWSGLPDTGP